MSIVEKLFKLKEAGSDVRTEVVAGITAMKGRPSSRAKYASETAVEPLEASITGAPSRSQPFASEYRNSERASRCFRLPVG